MPALVVLSLMCAVLMGFAIQRGATCMVAAIEELVAQRRASRLIAMLEASAFVAGGLIIAQLSGLLAMPPATFAVTGLTILGGMILGAGAFTAGACVFGAIARLGSGNWAYGLVPVGFFFGSLAAVSLGMSVAPMETPAPSLLLGQGLMFAGPLALLAAWRLWMSIIAARKGAFAAYVWSPHIATMIIGFAFIILLLAVGPWAYTDVLADAARGMSHNSALRVTLLLALFGGGVLGGWTAGRLGAVRPTRRAIVRCLAGGALMGLGSALVPGSNDGLILVGLPLLLPHAWVALASMAAMIAALIFAKQSSESLASGAEMA